MVKDTADRIIPFTKKSLLQPTIANTPAGPVLNLAGLFRTLKFKDKIVL